MVRVMPTCRSEWAEGMQAEIETIEAPWAALAFALGCAGVGYGRRLQSVSGVLIAIRWSVAMVTLVFAGLVLANAGWAWGRPSLGPLPLIFAGLGLAFGVAGLALARSGPRPLAALAGMMLALNTVCLWIIGHTVVVHADVYRALIVEGYLLWSALLLAGLTLRYAARSPRLAAMALARGWDA